MDVGVDEAGEEVLAGTAGVDGVGAGGAGARVDLARFVDARDCVRGTKDVGVVLVGGGDDVGVADEQGHGSSDAAGGMKRGSVFHLAAGAPFGGLQGGLFGRWRERIGGCGWCGIGIYRWGIGRCGFGFALGLECRTAGFLAAGALRLAEGFGVGITEDCGGLQRGRSLLNCTQSRDCGLCGRAAGRRRAGTVMDLRGFEPLTSAMRTRRSPN